MALGFRQVQTPTGMVLVPEDQAAAFGLAPVMQPDMGAPTLPQPAESPVPDVALAPPPPEDAGLTQIEPPPAAAPPPEAAPQPQAAPSPATQPIADTPPAAEAPKAEPAPSKPLSQTTYDDLATRYAQDTQAQIGAAQKVGEAEAQQAAEVANAMQERDKIATAKIAEMEEKRAADEAAIKQKEQVWQAKQDEWMKAKVTRRGMSTGELVMAAIAGLGSALKGQGDQNPALGVIMSNIQRDVDDQIRERDELGKQAGALKGAVDYAREVASNAQAQRVAAYGLEMQRQAQMLETVSKRMEPGIKRANMEQTAATLGAQGTQLYGQALQAQHAEDAQKAALAQQERESRRQAYARSQALAQDQRQFDATDKRIRDLAALDYNKEINKAIATGDVERAKLLAAQQKEERELAVGGGGALVGGMAPAGAIKASNDLNKLLGLDKRINLPGFDEQGRLLQPDGTVFKAPDTAEAGKLRKLVSSTITSQQLIDKTLRLIKKHGWESDLFKNPEFLQMKSTYNSLILEGKTTGELGVLAGPDMGIMNDIYGGDPTQLRDPSEALRTARDNVGLKTQNDLAVKGYAGSAFVVPDAADETKAPKDPDIAALMADEEPEGAAAASRARVASGGAPTVNVLTGKPQGAATKPAAPAPTMSRNQELALEDLVKRAGVLKAPDGKVNPDADVAVSGLIEAAQRAPTKGARDAAAARLVELATSGHPLVQMRLREFQSVLPGRRAR